MTRTIAIIVALIGVLALTGTALGAHSGETTVNLRARVADGEADGVLVCLRGGHRTVCGETEDGELWVDSLPQAGYRAWVQPPTGHALIAVSCTESSTGATYPCKVRDNEVRFVLRKGVQAVNVVFHLSAP